MDGVSKLGVDVVMKEMPRNMNFTADTTSSGLKERYSMDKNLRLKMTHAICYTCTGRNSFN